MTSPDVGKGSGTVRSFLVSLVATLVFVSIVLASAGRVTVFQAWVYAAISLGLNVAQRVILSANPELARERAKPGAPTSADRALLGIGLLLTLAMLVTAGLQLRFEGGPSLSTTWFVVGVALQVGGAALFLWALHANTFFSAVVRIQSEREHVVCTTGPYRSVRHPGNLGMLVGALGFPLLFQSSWSLVPAGLFAVSLIVRTSLEDTLLTRELDGYRAYREQTRFRLFPGLW